VFSVEQYADAVVITPRCDLDPLTRAELASALRTAGQGTSGKVIVSLDECEYADSSALSALAIARRTLGDRLVIVIAPNASIARVFTVTDFHKVVSIVPSIEEALGVHVA
jgi:anti-anti-sigma factor